MHNCLLFVTVSEINYLMVNVTVRLLISKLFSHVLCLFFFRIKHGVLIYIIMALMSGSRISYRKQWEHSAPNFNSKHRKPLLGGICAVKRHAPPIFGLPANYLSSSQSDSS